MHRVKSFSGPLLLRNRVISSISHHECCIRFQCCLLFQISTRDHQARSSSCLYVRCPHIIMTMILFIATITFTDFLRYPFMGIQNLEPKETSCIATHGQNDGHVYCTSQLTCPPGSDKLFQCKENTIIAYGITLITPRLHSR